jgi:hypothetical protein
MVIEPEHYYHGLQQQFIILAKTVKHCFIAIVIINFHLYTNSSSSKMHVQKGKSSMVQSLLICYITDNSKLYNKYGEIVTQK